MGAYENIKDANSNRTPNERRELAKKAGIASGEARRRKANFRKTLNMLLTAEVDTELSPMLKELGLDSTLESAVNMAMIKEAMMGNVKAYEAIAKYSGQSSQTDADLKEQEIRTDRAKRARDQEVGDTDSQEDNIKNFLNAIRPNQEELDNLFAEEKEEEADGEETEENSGI